MKYALLIDSENAQPRMDEIFQELSKYGDTPIRYLVGNFTTSQVSPWLSVCQKNAITCIQTMNFTKGKNSLDISLVIEGMKILYEKSFIDGIIIIASDSDYTPLARVWRNAGKEVIGIGKKITPESYRSSCTSFIFTENIFVDKKEDDIDTESSFTPISKIIEVTESVLNSLDGKAQLSRVVEAIRKAYPDFDARNYGYKKSLDLFKNECPTITVNEEIENNYVLSFVDKKDNSKKEAKANTASSKKGKNTKKTNDKKTKQQSKKKTTKKNTPKKKANVVVEEVEDDLEIND